MTDIRARLVDIALEWEKEFSVIPRITSEISEFDAAVLIGCNEEQYATIKKGVTAVTKGFDFVYNEKRYQITLRYDHDDETELLIRVLSFGPMLRVVGPESFISLIRERLVKQKDCGLN